MYEFACHEGNYSMANILAGARAAEKTGATISGRVRDAYGQPVSNVSVGVSRVDYHRDGYPILLNASTTSNAKANERGEYQIFPIPAGEYYVIAQPPPTPGLPTVRTFYPGELTSAQATPIVVRESEKWRDIDIEIRTA